jgi:RHS repeat-associated protein
MDDGGNIIAAYDSNNEGASYEYGSSGQLLSLMDPSGRYTKFSYDEEGRPFNIIKGNGIKTTNLFDSVGRISAIEDPGNPNNSIFFYKYDANSNIIEIQGVNGSQRFVYDALNRLTSWTNEADVVTTYAYDAVGNLTKKGSRTFTYNAVNEITNTGFTYNTNGNLTSDGNFNYQYDSENRLTKVTKVSDGTTVATYEYDFRGLRVRKTTAAGIVNYHWDDNGRLVRESDENSNTKALYTYAGQQLVSIEKGGQTYYTHTNHRGDILAITDANQNKVATYSYGPWGELLGQTGSFDQPFRYAGYYFDSETGMYYLKSRYYSPELGRFLTKDTFPGLNAAPQSLNLYAYCMGNPIIGIDPTGTHTTYYNDKKLTHTHMAPGIWYSEPVFTGSEKVQTLHDGLKTRYNYYVFIGWSAFLSLVGVATLHQVFSKVKYVNALWIVIGFIAVTNLGADDFGPRYKLSYYNYGKKAASDIGDDGGLSATDRWKLESLLWWETNKILIFGEGPGQISLSGSTENSFYNLL